MTTRIKRIAISLMVAFGLAVPALVPAAVSAQDINDNLCNGANLNFGSDAAGCEGDTDISGAGNQVDNIIKTVIDILSLAVGVVSVIMIIVGGLRYVISSGESGSVTSAKNTILYAVVGLVIVALAQIIVRFVVGEVTTGTSTTTT